VNASACPATTNVHALVMVGGARRYGDVKRWERCRGSAIRDGNHDRIVPFLDGGR
jgi:hypothetical protein